MESSKKSAIVSSNQTRLFNILSARVCRVSGDKRVVTPGQVLDSFTAAFWDKDFCRRWILERIHQEGPACPYCNAVIDDDWRLQRFGAGKRIECQFYNKFFTATSGTFLAGGHMG